MNELHKNIVLLSENNYKFRYYFYNLPNNINNDEKSKYINQRCVNTKRDSSDGPIKLPENISLYYKSNSFNEFFINLKICNYCELNFENINNIIVVVDIFKDELKDFNKKILLPFNKPIYFIDNLTELFLKFNNNLEEIYQILFNKIQQFNDLVDNKCDIFNNVIFGCYNNNWGFTLKSIANMWAFKFNMTKDDLTDYLWGENYFNFKDKKWYNMKVNDSIRGFNFICIKVILDIINMANDYYNNKYSFKFNNLIEFLGINLEKLHYIKKNMSNEEFIGYFLSKYLPLPDIIFKTIIL